MSRLTGGMASPWINFLVCFRKRVRFPARVQKKAVPMTAFFCIVLYLNKSVTVVSAEVSDRVQTSALSSTGTPLISVGVLKV